MGCSEVPYEQMYPWHRELTGGTRGDAMVLRMTVIANLQRGPNRWRRLWMSLAPPCLVQVLVKVAQRA
jgi:hypothetical protein